MNKKITALIGISASGKSTYAREVWEKDPLNTVIVNRDSIRLALFGFTDTNVFEYYQHKDFSSLEKEVTKYQNSLIYDALELNRHVIIDATNLDYSRDLLNLKMWNVPVELKYFPIEVNEAVGRDNVRFRSVGRDIIKRQYQRFEKVTIRLAKEPIDFTPVKLERDKSKPWVYLVDVDNTLALRGSRSPYDWNRVGEDTDNEDVSTAVRHLYNSFKGSEDMSLFILTGRDGVCVNETEQWLSLHNIDYDGIYIRNRGDNRPDWIIKREFVQEIDKDYYIAGLWDDRLSISRSARMLGLTVFNVNHGNF